MNENGVLNLTDAFQLIERAVNAVPVDGLPRLMGDLECLKAMAALRLRTWAPAPITQPEGEVRYLSVKETSERFHVSEKWLYRNKHRMPHSQPSRKVLLFPEQAATKWFAGRKKA